jgi:hypothetical protein
MSGRDCDLMTHEEMALCKGFVELLATVAAQGELSREHAFDLAGRWFLQRFKTELDAWQAVDFPRAAEKSKAGSLNLEEWRGDVLVTILRELFRPVCGGFVDAYRLNWRKLLASIRDRLKNTVAGTFLEEPVPFRSGSFTPLSCLESVRPRKGLLHNHGLDLGAFAQLTMLMPRVGQVGIYDLQQERAKKYLDDHPNPAPTLAGLESRGLTKGCLLAERIPACLNYDIVTHWLGNAPGTWEYEIMEMAPDGERLRQVFPVSFKGRNEVTHTGIHKTTLFRQAGRYGIQIRIGGAKLAETFFEVATVAAQTPVEQVRPGNPATG